MAGTDPIYYWDSCLFLAWIKDEERKSGDMDGVREVIQRVKQRDARIITSVRRRSARQAHPDRGDGADRWSAAPRLR